MKSKHKHEWGYVTHETIKVELYKPSPVGALCIHCHKLRRGFESRPAAPPLEEGLA